MEMSGQLHTRAALLPENTNTVCGKNAQFLHVKVVLTVTTLLQSDK